MAWISVHEQLRDHRKVRDLMRAMNCSRQEAVGTLVMLWTWAVNNADKCGNLTNTTAADIVDGIMSRGQSAGNVVDALVSTGWLEKVAEDQYCLHDWDIWQKQWYKRMETVEKDADRKRRVRSINSSFPTDSPKEIPLDKHTERRTDVQHSPIPSTASSPTPKRRSRRAGEGDCSDEQSAPPQDPEPNHLYGEFLNVRLTDSEHQKLTNRYGEKIRDEYIERLSGYLKQKGPKYKDHYATILNWCRRDKVNEQTSEPKEADLYLARWK